MPDDAPATLCPVCGYDRSGEGAAHCPECGNSDATVSREIVRTWYAKRRTGMLAILANAVALIVVLAAAAGPMMLFGSPVVIVLAWLILGIHVAALMLSVAACIAHLGEPSLMQWRRWKINLLFLPLGLDVLALASLWVHYGIL